MIKPINNENLGPNSGSEHSSEKESNIERFHTAIIKVAEAIDILEENDVFSNCRIALTGAVLNEPKPPKDLDFIIVYDKKNPGNIAYMKDRIDAILSDDTIDADTRNIINFILTTDIYELHDKPYIAGIKIDIKTYNAESYLKELEKSTEKAHEESIRKTYHIAGYRRLARNEKTTFRRVCLPTYALLLSLKTRTPEEAIYPFHDFLSNNRNYIPVFFPEFQRRFETLSSTFWKPEAGRGIIFKDSILNDPYHTIAEFLETTLVRDIKLGKIRVENEILENNIFESINRIITRLRNKEQPSEEDLNMALLNVTELINTEPTLSEIIRKKLVLTSGQVGLGTTALQFSNKTSVLLRGSTDYTTVDGKKVKLFHRIDPEYISKLRNIYS